MTLPEPPIRLCCMTRHDGPVCPDMKVMCALCFERVSIEGLYVDAHDGVWDVCKPCGEQNAEARRLPP